MIWLWRICSSAALAAPLIAANVSGAVRLEDSAVAAVRNKLDYSGVVVWLEPLTPGGPRTLPGEHARMLQKDKSFVPHVLAVQAGTTVDFPNFDPIFHNAFSKYNGQIFDVGLYPPGTSRSVRFGRPGVVRVFCNIHAAMSAVIAVVDTPWFGTSGRAGEVTIAGVPPGEYRLRVFHERATQAALDALTRTIVVNDAPLQLGTIGISESGYLPIPHQNKYGRAYPANNGNYPADR